MPRSLDRIAYRLLRTLPPETAHDVGKWAMRHVRPLRRPPRRPTTLFGIDLANPIGLAAGFDKAGELPEAAAAYGFGWVEVGSLTARGGAGNPRPRLFRIGAGDLLNRMGLNGPPATVAADRLRHVSTARPDVRFAVNVAKTHDPRIIGDAAIRDVVETFRRVHDLGVYVVLNVSCPNTREGKTFERPDALAELLAAVGEARTPASRPWCVKWSPMDDLSRLDELLAVTEATGVDGYVAVNTRPTEHPRRGRGGLSGSVLREVARRQVRHLVESTGKPVIGVGGVASAADVAAMLDAGAAGVQAYTGFVRGPNAGGSFVADLLADAPSAAATRVPSTGQGSA